MRVTDMRSAAEIQNMADLVHRRALQVDGAGADALGSCEVLTSEHRACKLLVMDKVTALTKTLRGGATATVTIEAATAWTGAVTRSFVNGKEIGNHCGPHHLRANLPPGHVAAVGPLVLTQREADQVEAAYYAFVAGQSRDLDAERRLLVAARNAAVVAAELDKEAAINTYTGGGDPWPGRQAAEERIFERSVALGLFDRDYPEAAAKAATAQAAATERAMWS